MHVHPDVYRKLALSIHAGQHQHRPGPSGADLRDWLRLLDDRLIPAAELWVAWNEANAQLELTKDKHDRRCLQLVRYTAVCPICAGTLELRYS